MIWCKIGVGGGGEEIGPMEEKMDKDTGTAESGRVEEEFIHWSQTFCLL